MPTCLHALLCSQLAIELSCSLMFLLPFPHAAYTVMHLDLASLESVRVFVSNFRRDGFGLDVLVCNAAVYLPTAKVRFRVWPRRFRV